MGDSFDLRRFVDEQSPVYARVVEELSAGHKRSHWMWFVFPQIAGLGFQRHGPAFRHRLARRGLAYLTHDILGPRLLECTNLVMATSEKTINDILGSPDDMKFRSSMTLFDAVSEQEIFAEAIAAFYPEGRTVRRWQFSKRTNARNCGIGTTRTPPGHVFPTES